AIRVCLRRSPQFSWTPKRGNGGPERKRGTPSRRSRHSCGARELWPRCSGFRDRALLRRATRAAGAERCRCHRAHREPEASSRQAGAVTIEVWPDLLRARQEISKLDEILVLHPIDDVRHRRVVAAPRIVLVAAQGLEQIILALAGEPGHVLPALEIRLMTEIAPVLFGQHPAVL